MIAVPRKQKGLSHLQLSFLIQIFLNELFRGQSIITCSCEMPPVKRKMHNLKYIGKGLYGILMVIWELLFGFMF